MVNPEIFNRTIGSLVNRKTKGLKIGLEIEVEGINLPRDFFRFWALHDDGSLRGQDNAEYVLTKPLEKEKVVDALNYLDMKIKESKAKINQESDRTSVHVHLNACDLTVRQVFTFWTLYTIFEDLLFEIAGDERRGNLFCLRLKDTDYLVKEMLASLEQMRCWPAENLRYSAFNLASIRKHGSLEFRQLHGTTDINEIEKWITTLCCLLEASKVYKDPQEVIAAFSKAGYLLFFKHTFKDLPYDLQAKLRVYNLRDFMFEGMRLAQDIAWMVVSWGDSLTNVVNAAKTDNKAIVDMEVREAVDEVRPNDPPVLQQRWFREEPAN